MSEARSPITSTATLLDFFRQELELAGRMLGVQTSDETRAYVIHMLDGYTRTTPTNTAQLGFDRAAALMLSDAVYSAGEHRIEAYRQLGDACLYNCGFFLARLTRRHMRVEYYQQIGRAAYDRLSALFAAKPGGDLFGAIFDELAAQFEVMTKVLQQMSASFSPQGRAQQALLQHAEQHAWVLSAPTDKLKL